MKPNPQSNTNSVTKEWGIKMHIVENEIPDAAIGQTVAQELMAKAEPLWKKGCLVKYGRHAHMVKLAEAGELWIWCI